MHNILPVQLCDPVDCSPPGSSVHGISLLQGIFLTQNSNPRLLHWQADSLPLSHLESLHNIMDTDNNSVL